MFSFARVFALYTWSVESSGNIEPPSRQSVRIPDGSRQYNTTVLLQYNLPFTPPSRNPTPYVSQEFAFLDAGLGKKWILTAALPLLADPFPPMRRGAARIDSCRRLVGDMTFCIPGLRFPCLAAAFGKPMVPVKKLSHHKYRNMGPLPGLTVNGLHLGTQPRSLASHEAGNPGAWDPAPSISPESCPTRLWEKARLANGHLAIRIVASLSAYVMHGTLVLTAVKPPSAGRQTVVPSTYIASIMYNDPVRIGAGSFFGAPQ
ncbi:hypothetical protein MHUMG1_00964 [Metarhizium humberi]|uniref:Uncharacterized protein n=1 Tax=Metarhizium humberi TaxID=2596975 RepID=A0A9P8MK05_9HYPO|nr:hypothetical protein MHUMG1_00964 [Metarhizium humberi]